MLKFGRITKVDTAKCLFKVNFEQDGNLESDWMSPVTFGTGIKSREQFWFDVGAHVACMVDENCEDGVILGCVFNDNDAPFVADGKTFGIKFQDGTTIKYNTQNHKYTIDVVGDVEISATGSMRLTCVNVDIQGQLNVSGDVRALNGTVGLGTHTHVETGGTTAPGLG